MYSSDISNQEAVTKTGDIANKSEVNGNSLNARDKGSTADTPSPEKTPSAVSTPETQTAKASESAEAAGTGSYSKESKPPEPVRVAAAPEAPSKAPAPAEPDNHAGVLENLPESATAVVSPSETEQLEIELDEKPGENLRIDEQHLDLTPEIQTGPDYAEIEAVGIQDDTEHDMFLPADEPPEYLEEFVEYEISRAPDNQEFMISAEAEAFNTKEHAPEAPELTAELGVPLEAVEESIGLITDAIEELEPEESETVHEILDEIVAKIAQAQTPVEDGTQNLEAVAETIDAEEELKELFIELFDYLEVEYSLELVESFVKLALQGDMSDLLEAIKQNEENNAAQDRGTHEVIKQLLANLQKIKAALVHAYNLGKSAMRLCFFEYSIGLP